MSDDWMIEAACNGRAAAMSDHSPEGVAVALALCHGEDGIADPCPVRRQCKTWALSQPLGYDGVAGGVWLVNGRQRTPPHPVSFRGPDRNRDIVRAGHAAYARGERDPETVDLEREYQRLRKRDNRGSAIDAQMCSDCGREMLMDGQVGPGVKHKARGLCRPCWRDHDAAGTLHQFTRRARTSVSVVEDYEFLVGAGYTREEIAERLGIKVGSLMHALRRAGKKAA